MVIDVKKCEYFSNTEDLKASKEVTCSDKAILAQLFSHSDHLYTFLGSRRQTTTPLANKISQHSGDRERQATVSARPTWSTD